jgi:hypothetical protein
MREKTLLRRKTMIQVEGTRTEAIAAMVITTVELKLILNMMILPRGLTSSA